MLHTPQNYCLRHLNHRVDFLNVQWRRKAEKKTLFEMDQSGIEFAPPFFDHAVLK